MVQYTSQCNTQNLQKHFPWGSAIEANTKSAIFCDITLAALATDGQAQLYNTSQYVGIEYYYVDRCSPFCWFLDLPLINWPNIKHLTSIIRYLRVSGDAVAPPI